jgi:GST-like protein
MIELLGMSSPNVQKVQIMLEETGLPYKIRRVDVWKGENYTPEFEALNPLRKVPIVIDDDGPDGQPCTVFESGAILIYLAEKSGMFLPAKGATRYAVLEWLAVQMAGIGPMFGQYTHFRVFAPKGNDYAEDRYRTQAVRLFEALDKRLSEAAYLGGDDYSIADIATYPWTRDRASKWGGDWDGYKHFRRWYDQVSERPAVQRMKAEMDPVWQTDLASIATASVEITDRFLGRGEFAREPNK